MNYRERIYKFYSSARNSSLIPTDISGLSNREPYFKDIIERYFPKNKDINILELGCGHGSFQFFINDAGYTNSKGIDGSEEQVKGAKELGINNVIYGDILEYLISLDDCSLDLIVAIDIFEHFTKVELTELIDHLYRVLNIGGMIISHQPNSEGPYGNYIRHSDYTHEISFTRQSIAQIFLASNFKKIESYEDKPIVHGIKSALRFFVWEFVLRKIYVFTRVVENGSCDKDAIFSQNFISVITK